ncbi:MAG: hypothetical protein ABIG96_03795 [Candidatus Micrarchaeota archaeon]
MGWIENTLQNLLKDLGTSIRKFTAFIFLVFTVGIIAGRHIIERGDPSLLQLSLAVPLMLALMSYLFVEIAVVFFVLFLIVIMFL